MFSKFTITTLEYQSRQPKNSPGAEGAVDEPHPGKNPWSQESAEALRDTNIQGQAPSEKGFFYIVHQSVGSKQRLWEKC
jgi:hypothetical protein